MTEITRQDVERLKAEWSEDPSYGDIENTEGFEAYREELLAFRKEQEAFWQAEREERLMEKRVRAAKKRCPMNDHCFCISDECAWWLDDIEKCAIIKLAKIPDAVNEMVQIYADSQPPASYYRQ